ncbi:MAG: GDP-L-fucose synthase, partial [Acidobacteria bacterium]|nr:GDP-L-fucose synthase [Acidobacteriota bacterium]
LAAERYDGPEPINIGSGEEISIRDLVDLIRELTGYRGDVEWDTGKPDGQPRRRIDTTRAREWLGWQARTPLREGLRRTIEWYRTYRPEA